MAESKVVSSSSRRRRDRRSSSKNRTQVQDLNVQVSEEFNDDSNTTNPTTRSRVVSSSSRRRRDRRSSSKNRTQVQDLNVQVSEEFDDDSNTNPSIEEENSTIYIGDNDNDNDNDNDLVRTLRKNLFHWTRSITISALSAMSTNNRDIKYALGGLLAIEYYLDGTLLEEWYINHILSSPVSIHVENGSSLKTFSRHLVEFMNNFTIIEAGTRHSCVYMIASILRKMGINIHIGAITIWKMFRILEDKNNRTFVIVLDCGDVLTAEGLTIRIPFVNIHSMTTNISRHIFKDKSILVKPYFHDIHAPLMPFSQVKRFCQNKSSSNFLTRAYHNGLVLLNGINQPYNVMCVPYRSYTRSNRYKDICRLARENAINSTLATIKNKDTAMIQREYYNAERNWLSSDVSKSERLLLWLYTVESSRFNIACLLSGLMPETYASMMHQRFRKHANHYSGDFEKFMRDLIDVFYRLVNRKPPELRNRSENLYVYRAIKLFEFSNPNSTPNNNQSPYASIFTCGLPFIIHNNTFCSTSVDIGVSKNFLSNSSPCCILKIRLKPGFDKFLAIENLSGYSSEEEILLPAKTAFQVYNRTFMRNDNNGRMVLVFHADAWVPSPRTTRDARIYNHYYVDLSVVSNNNIDTSAQCVESSYTCDSPLELETIHSELARRALMDEKEATVKGTTTSISRSSRS